MNNYEKTIKELEEILGMTKEEIEKLLKGQQKSIDKQHIIVYNSIIKQGKKKVNKNGK